MVVLRRSIGRIQVRRSKITKASGRRLEAAVSGDVRTDVASRARYATDASIYQMIPEAVVIYRAYCC